MHVQECDEIGSCFLTSHWRVVSTGANGSCAMLSTGAWLVLSLGLSAVAYDFLLVLFPKEALQPVVVVVHMSC
jgi:hypothetical protein